MVLQEGVNVREEVFHQQRQMQPSNSTAQENRICSLEIADRLCCECVGGNGDDWGRGRCSQLGR